MSNNWNVFDTSRSASLVRRTGLSDYLELAEANRHIHFAEGMAELEGRMAGRTPDSDLDNHVVFAQNVQLFAEKLRAAQMMNEDAYQALKKFTQLVWCCCFTDREACDNIADLLEQDYGWKARAEFIMTLAQVRDSLNSDQRDAPDRQVQDAESAAQSRLRDRWLNEAVIVDFAAPEYAEPCAQASWMTRLDGDSLHEFVLNCYLMSEPCFTLAVVAQSATCDRATIMTLLCRYLREGHTAPRLRRNKSLRKIMETAYQRIMSGDFATSRLLPGDNLSDLQVSQASLAHQITQGRSLPESAFEGFGTARHRPKYAYHGATRKFLTPFSDWSAIRIVA